MSDPTSTHPPIRGLRAMAIVRWILLVAVAGVAVASWWYFVFAPTEVAHADRYYCPMHPEIRVAEPGTCPICHMSLEPIPDATTVRTDAGTAAEPEPIALTPVMLTTERRQRAGIAIVAAQRIAIDGEQRWPATIEASEGARAEVRVRTEAFVERVAIAQSDVRVRAGQVLAWVYAPAIVRAQEELLVAHRWGAEQAPAQAAARERLRLLGVRDADIDAIVAEGRARRSIALRAPIAGRITRFEAVVGTYATPEAVLYEVTDLARVRVVASPLTIDPSALGPRTVAHFEARDRRVQVPLAFELVEPRVAADTRASRVRFLPRQPAGDAAALEDALRPGDIGEVVVRGDASEALVVPRDAVVDTGAAQYVFVEREAGLFEPRPVVLGGLHGELRVILEGLREGERVVARGAFVLDSESRLQAALAPADAGALGASR